MSEVDYIYSGIDRTYLIASRLPDVLRAGDNNRPPAHVRNSEHPPTILRANSRYGVRTGCAGGFVPSRIPRHKGSLHHEHSELQKCKWG
jgi:hypothetical protein